MKKSNVRNTKIYNFNKEEKGDRINLKLNLQENDGSPNSLVRSDSLVYLALFFMDKMNMVWTIDVNRDWSSCNKERQLCLCKFGV